ncbi:MAG: hypothetical protein IJH58_05430 [Clostridia bacterium]|nr:hypothetical protein [Clostridia bacterium]
MNHYPTVFVHGFIGWGEEDGLTSKLGIDYFGLKHGVQDYLRKEGFEVYTPAIGPFNSLWDRCCVLYAQLYGGRVDYGKVHSEKYGHERYGRTYPGLLKDLGTPGDHEKINLVGHSFGGPTVRLFDYLMAYGSEEERNGTPADELSGLFKGGKGDCIHTVTTLSGVNNGTTYAAWHGILVNKFLCYYVMYFVTLLGNSWVGKYYDPMMEQWGVMKNPEKVKIRRFRLPTYEWLKMYRFANNEFDNSAFELGIYVMEKLNKDIHAHEGTYYFAHRACRSHKGLFGLQTPDKEMSLFCKDAGYITSHIITPKMRRHGINKDWLPTDGYVNTISTGAPLTEEATEWKEGMTVTPGHWYNMPVVRFDHVSWNGLKETGEDMRKLYKDLLTKFANLA